MIEFIENLRYEILTPDGWSDFKGIRRSKNVCLRLVFNDKTAFECTKEHQILIGDRWICAKELNVGDTISGKTIVDILQTEEQYVYDPVDVEKNNQYLSDEIVSHNCCMIDEYAFIPTNLAEEFFTSVYPTLSSGKDSKIIVVSTPNGMNHFYKMWQEAVDGINGFDTVSADWRAVPWRDEKWATEQRGVLGEQKFSQEMETAFIGASNTLISGSKITSIPIAQPLLHNSNTSVYSRPEPGRKYTMMVDTARGTGGDFSAFVIIDVTEIPYKVVLKYKNNTISSMVYPNIINKMALEYNNCPIMVETNDVGESVANDLYYSLENEEVVMSRSGEIVLWGSGTSTPGVRTTTKTKRIGCDVLKQLVENDKLVINDYDILHELSNFVVKGKSYEADVGNDDLVMCLVMFAYLTTTPKFEEMTDSLVKERIILERREAEEFDMIPTGFYNDGTEKPQEIFNF
jgi:hypothetical protein